MKLATKITASLAALALGVVALAGCGVTTEQANYEERKALATEYDRADSLELKNLKEKRSREDDPSAIRYLYLMSFGQIIGYYVTEGKVSSSGSQIAPESELIAPYSTSSERFVVESAKDDGSYGPGDPGIFFFTTEGVMVETSLDYIQSDAPLAIDVPRLGGTDK
ncbi:membrane protein [Microbacterium phage Caron]|uniref:Membrane protein n=1 Tax=Microbacterium phage Caron TaxID=3028494 RepID=A0AAE9ZK13_9CAUD|nr:membrane protein [Microbacterium phage Caron]